MSEENQALQRQLLQKQAKELEQLKVFSSLFSNSYNCTIILEVFSSSGLFISQTSEMHLCYKLLLVQLNKLYQLFPHI